MSATRGTILIVEDNALNLELATDLLTAAGYSIRQARTGEEGLRLAQGDPPDLILMDLRLPGMDGYAALRRLRADPRTAQIPTIALTAQAMRGDQDAALAAGFDDYISKPISTATFPQTVARVLGSNGRSQTLPGTNCSMADPGLRSPPQLPPESDARVSAWMRKQGWNVAPARWETDPETGFFVWEDDPATGRSHALWVAEYMIRDLSAEQLVEALNSEGMAEELRINFKVRIEERGDEYRVSVVPRRSGESRRQD